MTVIRFYQGKIIRDGQILEGEIWVKNGIIVPLQQHADKEINLKGRYLAPGYIDLQINGGFGVDFSTDLAQVPLVAKELLKYGVTAFLPTLISSPKERYHEQIPLFKSTRGGDDGATTLGLHLEGPYFNQKQRGAHSSEYIKNFEEESVEALYGDLHAIKMITLAPELPGALDVIRNLRDKEIVVSAGHTNATEEEFRKGVKEGISCATHLYNAMPSFHHRQSGVVGTVFDDPNLYFSIIADGIHVNDVGIRLAWRMNPKGLFLVSDAVALWGIENIKGTLGNVDILSNAKRAYVSETGRLAGGLMGLDANVRHLHHCLGCSIPYAVEAASSKPAKVLGLQDIYGSLNEGCYADMIVLDEKLHVLTTYIGGECVHGLDKLDYHD